MSKPRYGWWSYAKYMVRSYPILKAEYQELHRQRVTSSPYGISSNAVARRTTEDVAMLNLPPSKQAEYDAVTKAVEVTSRLRTGKDRLAIIDMVFWKQSHTLDGAAYAIGYSESQAKRFHGDFLRLVGMYRGLCEEDEIA